MVHTLKKSTNSKSAKSSKSAKKVRKKAPWDYDQIEELLGFLRERGVSRFEYQVKETKISIDVGGVSSSPVLVAAQTTVTKKMEVSPVQQQEENSKLKKITSPFVGTFYSAASPTSSPYVKEGQSVKKGDVLCIVEAMKLMNEIESDLSGKIHSVLAENGQPVEYGQPLFLVEG